MVTKNPLQVIFFQSDRRNEPVRDWLRGLPAGEKKIIGEDIKTLQYGWPIGMPLARNLGKGLWEVKSSLENRIARVLFTIHKNHIVLLHGLIKKSQKTPPKDIALAKRRMSKFKER